MDARWIVVGLLLQASAAQACSCVQIAFESKVDLADTILVVRITAVEDAAELHRRNIWIRKELEVPPGSGASDYGIRARFRTLRRLKLTGAEPGFLHTGYGGGDCGLELLPGRNYLVLTDVRGGVGLCSGSQLVGFSDAISCPMQRWLASIERRVHDRNSPVAPIEADEYRSPLAIDDRVQDALRAGKSAFDAGCEEAPDPAGR